MQNNLESLSTQIISETPIEDLWKKYTEIWVSIIKKNISEYINWINTISVWKRNIAKENISWDIVLSYETNNWKKISILWDIQWSWDEAWVYADKIKNFIENNKYTNTTELIHNLDDYISKNDLPYLVMIFFEYDYKKWDTKIISIWYNSPIFTIESNWIKEIEIASSWNFWLWKYGHNLEPKYEILKKNRTFWILTYSDWFIEKAKKWWEKRHKDFTDFLEKNKVRFSKMEPNQIINYIIKNFWIIKWDDISFIYQKISALSNLQ